MRIAALGAVGIASVLLVASFSLLAPEKASDQQAARNAPLPRPHRVDGDVISRPHYPYSVVPGGVHSTMELASAGRDPVVAAHYARVNMASARIETVRAPRRVHVSYRIGDRIYWTKRGVSTGSAVWRSTVYAAAGSGTGTRIDTPGCNWPDGWRVAGVASPSPQ